MESFLDWIVVILPFAGGVFLAVKPPKRKGSRWGLIVFGLAVSILTFLQQGRSRESHEKELVATTTRLDQTSQELGKLSGLLDRFIATRNPDEAKPLGEAVKQALQQAQRTARPNAPSGLTLTPH